MKTASNTLIRLDNHKDWFRCVSHCGGYDIYHLPQYHLLAENFGEGEPYLFVYRRDGESAALPFLLRPVFEVDGLEGCRYNDITSVYGYPGVVTSIQERDINADDFRKGFQKELKKLFHELAVVSFFTRTNPLMPNNWLFHEMTQVLPLSKTVAIDLSKTNEEQLGAMTKGHKYDIRKARNNEVIVEEDRFFKYIDDFIQIYNDTMKRNDALENYYFPKEYYLQLKRELDQSVKLYFARFEGKPISASIFFAAGGIIQYHLSGSLPQYFSLNGAKIILDEIRQWGMRNGYSWLHLGGGVGSSEDSLFRFKAGFSKTRFQFQVVRKIVNLEVYAELCSKRINWAHKNGYRLSEGNFFPDYRKHTIAD